MSESVARTVGPGKGSAGSAKRLQSAAPCLQGCVACEVGVRLRQISKSKTSSSPASHADPSYPIGQMPSWSLRWPPEASRKPPGAVRRRCCVSYLFSYLFSWLFSSTSDDCRPHFEAFGPSKTKHFHRKNNVFSRIPVFSPNRFFNSIWEANGRLLGLLWTPSGRPRRL